MITFDCFGTLVNWHEFPLREIDVVLADAKGDGSTAAKILDSFSAHSRRLTTEKPYRLYKDILRIGFTAAFRDHGKSPSADEIERFARAPAAMEPHPDVHDALRRLKARYKLAIFTNSDDDLIAPTAARISVPYDFIITSQQAQAYKPSQELFDYACQQMSVKAEETVHIAMGMYADMKACHELGLRSIWVNRSGERGNPEWIADAEVSDVSAAATLLLD